MVDDTFYKGFEGEEEVCFVCGETRLMMWEGYFETMLSSLVGKTEEDGGMLEVHCKCEGWYDGEPWLIEDVPLTIRQLSCFDENDVEIPIMKDALVKLNSAVISFLKENMEQDIFIEYDLW